MAMSMDFSDVRLLHIGFTPQEHCGVIANWLENHRDGWCQGAMARNEHSGGVGASDYDAVSFCAMGLLERFVPESQRDACVKLLSRGITPYREGATRRSNRSPVAYNDTAGRNVEDIIRMFRCASYMPDVTTCDPHELIEEQLGSLEMAAKQESYVKALKEAMMSPPPESNIVEVPNWMDYASLPPLKNVGHNDINPLKPPVLAGQEVMNMAAKLGLAPAKPWAKVVKEFKDTMLA